MRRRTVLAGAAGLFVAPTARAHPYHVSTTVAQLRAGNLEVTLQAAPEDLQEALTRLAGKDVDIDGDVESLIRTYVRRHFKVRGPEGPVALSWVGSEVELEVARLYFEFATPGSPHSYTLFNGAFFDIAPAQVNRVTIRRGETVRTLRFRSGDSPKRLG
ncbi:MAG: DUF6702 family protein [Myxococcota bacterium]